MSIRTEAWPAGTPSWADLASPDTDASKAFYGAVLGWEFSETGPEYGNYLLATVGGKNVAGIGGQQQPGPAAWTLYMATDDVEATAAAVKENGGRLVMEPMDVGELGRMIIATDPAGAFFGSWQAGLHIGAERYNEPGALSWEELLTPEPDAARAFYSAVFGYRHTPLEDAGEHYETFSLTGVMQDSLGGIGDMRGLTDVPPHWLVYFGVAEIDAAVGVARANGGEVPVTPFDTPFGRMAGLTDPAGAFFFVVQNPLS